MSSSIRIGIFGPSLDQPMFQKKHSKNIFLAYVNNNIQLNHKSLVIEVEGKKYDIVYEPDALHDPKNILLRS